MPVTGPRQEGRHGPRRQRTLCDSSAQHPGRRGGREDVRHDEEALWPLRPVNAAESMLPSRVHPNDGDDPGFLVTVRYPTIPGAVTGR